jgi:hypothetical protein
LIANPFYPYNIIYFRRNSEFLREFLIPKFFYGFFRSVILSAAILTVFIAAAFTVFIRSNSYRLHRNNFHHFHSQQFSPSSPQQLSLSSFVTALTVFTAIVFTVSTATILTVFTDFFAGRHAAIWKIDEFYIKNKLWKLIFNPYFIFLFDIESKTLKIDRRLI